MGCLFCLFVCLCVCVLLWITWPIQIRAFDLFRECVGSWSKNHLSSFSWRVPAHYIHRHGRSATPEWSHPSFFFFCRGVYVCVCVANALIEFHEIKKKLMWSFDRSVMNLFWHVITKRVIQVPCGCVCIWSTRSRAFFNSTNLNMHETFFTVVVRSENKTTKTRLLLCCCCCYCFVSEIMRREN